MIMLSIKGINGVSYAKQRMPKSILSFNLSLPLFDVNKAPHDYWNFHYLRNFTPLLSPYHLLQSLACLV